MMLRTLILVVGVAALTGCTHKSAKFDRGPLEKELGVEKSVVNEPDIKEVLSRHANLPKPFRLGVYFKRAASADWHWTGADKEALLESTKSLRSQKLASDIFPILDELVEDESLHSIRMAAAKYGADAVLIVSGTADIQKSLNDYGWSFLLVVPAFFVHGETVSTTFTARAIMWDVRNEFLYLTAEGEGKEEKKFAPTAIDTDEKLVATAKTQAMTDLGHEIGERVLGTR